MTIYIFTYLLANDIKELECWVRHLQVAKVGSIKRI